MALLRGLPGRNRGVFAAFGVLAILLPCWSWFEKPTPRASWTEPLPKSWFEGNGGNVEFAPDGRSVLTYDDETAKVRDLTTGRMTVLTRGGGRRLREARFMDGGRLLMAVVPGGDRLEDILPTIKAWDLPSGRERASFSDIGDGSGWDYAISDDGSTLGSLMGSPGPPTVGIWRASKDWQPRYFPGHGPFSLSADGRFLALFDTGNAKVRIAIWDVVSSESVVSIPVAPSESGEIALSADGKLLAVNAGDETFLWEEATSSRRNVLATVSGGIPWFSPDGSLLYQRDQVNDGQRVEVWDLAVDPPRRIFHGSVIDRSRDGRWIIQSGPNFEVANSWVDQVELNSLPKVVELPSMNTLGRKLDTTELNRAFGPDGRTLALRTDRDEPTWLGKLAGWLPRGLIPFRWSWRHKRDVRVLDVESGRVLASIEPPARFALDRFALVGDGKTLALHYLIPAAGQENHWQAIPWKDAGIELWDVPTRSFPWPVVGILAVVALGLGRWYDVRARWRANAAPALA